MSGRAMKREHGVGRRTIIKALSSDWPERRAARAPSQAVSTLPRLSSSPTPRRWATLRVVPEEQPWMRMMGAWLCS